MFCSVKNVGYRTLFVFKIIADFLEYEFIDWERQMSHYHSILVFHRDDFTKSIVFNASKAR